MEMEYNTNIDQYSNDLIISNIELLLNYCKRFYGRQFISRTKQNKDVIIKFEEYITTKFADNDEKYDIIFDTVGKGSFSNCKGLLNNNGIYLVTTGSMLKNYMLTQFSSLKSRIYSRKEVKKFIFAMSVDKSEALVFLKKLIEAGSLKPVVDRTYPFNEIVEAHEYVDKGHKKGNVVVID